MTIKKRSSIIWRKYGSICKGHRRILKTKILAGFLSAGELSKGGRCHLESSWYVRILCELISRSYMIVKGCL
jgi:hypothetical protein